MRIILCDDQESDRKQLIDNINNYCDINNLDIEICSYSDSIDLLSNFEVDKYSIVFLDIFINGISNMSGIDVAKKIREIDSNCMIIFTTVSSDFALDAYSVHAFDYLVKPVDYVQIEKTLNRCFSLISQPLKYIEVVSNRLLYRIHQKNILYVEVFNKYCLIHTISNTIKTYLSLSVIEKLLDAKIFLRCHRSYIVNLQHIKDFSETDFLLSNDQSVPIAKDKKVTLKQTYIDYLFNLTRN